MLATSMEGKMEISDNREYRHGYSRGYETGRRNNWPQQLSLPAPPNKLVAELFEAAKEIRDVADSYCATTMEDDELKLEF